MARNPFKPQLFTSQPKYQAREAQNNIVSTSITWTRLFKQRLWYYEQNKNLQSLHFNKTPRGADLFETI